MFFQILKTIIISLILIFLIHYLFLFFKDNLTIPKTKDLVAKPLEKYKTMDTVINNNIINNTNNNTNNTNISGTTSINNLSNSLNNESINNNSLNNNFDNNLYKNNNLDMKNELKSFFNQLNNI